MASYPAAVPSFSTKVDGPGNTIAAAHVNDLQSEITAVVSGLLNGLAHVLKPDATNTRDLGTTSVRWRDLFLSRDAVIAGAVTAASFAGDGSSLTSVPIAGVINDLTDVTIVSPTNGQVLTYNSGSGVWENAAPAGGGGPTALDDLTDVAITTPTDGQLLVYVAAAARWENAAPTTFPAGVIAGFGGATPPTGWLLCDGAEVSRTTYATLFGVIGTAYGIGDGSTTFNLPDLRQRFPLGKAASGTGNLLGATGGAIDHFHSTVLHKHARGTLAVLPHSHAAGTLVVAAHAHGAGSFAAASHTHGPGTLTVASHTHDVSVATSTDGAHTHTATLTGTSGATDVDPDSDSIFDSTGATAALTALLNANHTHSLSVSGTTASDGSHSHTIDTATDATAPAVTGGLTAATAPLVTGSSGSASPAVTGSTTSVAPGLTGDTAFDGGANTGNENPPFQVVNYIIKT